MLVFPNFLNIYIYIFLIIIASESSTVPRGPPRARSRCISPGGAQGVQRDRAAPRVGPGEEGRGGGEGEPSGLLLLVSFLFIFPFSF